MLYLKPVGGLCNRMRTIDSMIALCKKNNQDLFILWVNSHELNCNFEYLFKPINTKGINVTVIQNPNMDDFLIAHNIKNKNYIKSQFWFKLYNSKKHVTNGLSQNEVDEIFYNNNERLMNYFFSNISENFLIESYYRHCQVDQDSYTNFLPIDHILKKITQKVNEFNNTIGIHIRRTDHFRSIEVSTDPKISMQLNTILNKNPSTRFFISSDCNATKENLITQFGKNIITNPNLTFNRNNSDDIQHAVLDLFCLANTKKIYGSYFSSFSQVASDINNIENIIIK